MPLDTGADQSQKLDVGAVQSAPIIPAPTRPAVLDLVNLPLVPGSLGFLQLLAIEPPPSVQGPIYPPVSPPNSYPIPLEALAGPGIPGTLGFLEQFNEPVIHKRGPQAPPTSPPNNFPLPLVEVGPSLPGSIQFLLQHTEDYNSVQGAPNPPPPSPVTPVDPIVDDVFLLIPGTLPFLRLFYEPERLSIPSGDIGRNQLTMPLMVETPRIPGALWFSVDLGSDSSRGQPGPGPPPPPPLPPGPLPVSSLPLLNRLTRAPGVDPRLVRIADQISILWNSLARQGILRQTAIEDYTLVINELNYFAGVSSHWANSPPATVGAALDRIAALLAALSGGPIP